MVRTSEKVLEFDRVFIQEMLWKPGNNQEQLKNAVRALRLVMKNELTERQRQVMELVYFQNMRNHEIAQLLSLNPSTITRTRQRAEGRIHRFLRYYFISRRDWDTPD